MGNEQSDNRRPDSRQMSEVQVQRLLEAQRQAYERKLEEVAAREAAQRRMEAAAAQRRQDEAAAQKKRQEDAAAETKRREEAARASEQNAVRHTFSFSNNNLQQAAPSAPPAPQPMFNNVYPSLNTLNPTPVNNCGQSPVRPQYFQPPQSQDFVFVNNFGHVESHNRPTPPRPYGAVPPPRAFAGTSAQGARAAAPGTRAGPPPSRGASGAQGQRPRSVSRHRNASNDRDAFDCPTCRSRFGARIFTCDEGHSSCNECKTRQRPCGHGHCGRVITDRRNFDMEKTIAQTKAPCPHTSEGCKLYIKIEDMDAHIKECPFREQQCPINALFGTCHWRGKLSQLSTHFDNAHPNGRQTNVDSEMKLTNVRNNSQEVHLVNLGVYNFLLHVKVSEGDGKVYMAVQLIGTHFSAMKWTYEVHVYNKSENRRKYMYIDNCCSSNDKIDDLFKAGNCAVLPVWYANTFVCDGVLTYKFFIKKTNEGQENEGPRRQRRYGRGPNKNVKFTK